MPPTDNKLVRQALSYALDRKRIVDTIFSGSGTPEALPWETNSLAYDAAKNNAYGFDLEKAKSLLSQAGALKSRLRSGRQYRAGQSGGQQPGPALPEQSGADRHHPDDQAV